MNEYESSSYTEYVYDKRAEGKMRAVKYLLILGYVTFVVAYFLVCYLSRFIPIFAVCPFFLWILIHFTWHIVSYDVYYTFEHGNMEIGRIKRRKSGNVRRAYITLEVQKALLVSSYSEALDSGRLHDTVRVHDYSSSATSPNRIVVIYPTEKGCEAVIIENTPKLARLLAKYSGAARDVAYVEIT